jgi:4-amino-4-deoxy-L-arabinose transferase-like glycosyltransferase
MSAPESESQAASMPLPSAAGVADHALDPALDAAAPEAEEPGPPDLLPRGSPPEWLRGGAAAMLGAFVSIAVMGLDVQLRWGWVAGLLGVIVASWGVLDMVGSFGDPEARVVSRRTLGDLQTPLLGLGAVGAIGFVLLLLATRGTLPVPGAAIALPAAAIGLLVMIYRVGEALGPWAADETGQPRSLLHRHGFWVVAAALALYVPMAGAHSLTDPWETHYGEVAREMLSRDDWISTWWAQDGWFFSKPVLDFWLQALGMVALGVHYQPGQMLASAVAGGPTPRPEWAVRLPIVFLSVVALYLLYKGAARVFGRRAGMLGALVLMTMPQWSMLTHQTMTDLPFVAALSAAMGLLLLGLHTPPEELARCHELKVGRARLRLSAFHLVFGSILLCALPQIFYFVSRNLDLMIGATEGRHGFRWHPDVFWSGSKGNCGLPGNEPCVLFRPAIAWLQPGLQGLGWAAVVGGLLYLNWGERRVQRLCYQAAFFFAAISTLGKGPAGFVLPVLCALAYVGVTGRWRELSRLEILSGCLIILAVAMPWYAAMYVRHGPAFIDRLIFHDMWKRALTHVHDTNEGDDTSFRFYLWQLGYAVFPWTGLAPAALVWWLRRPDDADQGKGDASVFLAMWFLFAFGLFTWMQTKFHHYIFPAVPPVALLTGVLLDRLFGDAWRGDRLDRLDRLGALGFGVGWLAYGVFRMMPGSLDGFRGEAGALRPPSPALGGLALIVGALFAGWGAAPWFGRAERPEEPKPAGAEGTEDTEQAGSPYRLSPGSEGPAPEVVAAERHESLMLGAVALAGAALLVLVARDLTVRPEGDAVGDARLMHLFTYNYRRVWPESLDFTSSLAAIGATAAGLTALLASARLRPIAARMLLALGLIFGAWTLDLYFPRTAPHWGQRETIEAYFRNRRSADEPIVGYQMNWKGENFYTGNHLAAFVSTGERFKQWVREQRDRGVRTFFFVAEHGRVAGLKAELGNPTQVETLIDRRTNNKFTLVRVTFQD